MSSKRPLGQAATRRELLMRGGGIAASGMLLPTLLAACGGSGSSSSGGSGGGSGGTITEGNVADPQTFNPLIGQDFSSNIVSAMLFDGLLTVDATGNPVPAVAASLPKVSADGKTYVFQLRPEAKWSDGTALTADDVVFTFESMYLPKYRAFATAYSSTLAALIRSVRARDAHTVEIVTKTVSAPFLVAYATLGLLPRHVLGQMTGDQLNTAGYNLRPTVTNGAFRFVSWARGSEVRFAPNTHYYRTPSTLEAYVLKIVANPVSISQQATTGEIDIAPVNPDQFAGVKNASGITLKQFPSITVEVATYQLRPNVPSSRIFSDKGVRQALWMALDRQAIIDSVFFRTGAAFTNSPEPVGTWGHSDNVTPNYTANPTQAGAMLDSLGWTKNASGVREKDGVPMKFEILTAANADLLVPTIEAMAGQWSRIGVQASTRGVPIGVIIDQLLRTRTFDMILIGNNLVSADPDMTPYYHSRNTVPGALNAGGYSNPTMDAILDKAVATLDRSERKALYAQFQNIFAEDPPGIPVVSLVQAYAINQKVKNADFGTYDNYTPRPFASQLSVS
jgi:peptide/nickel transport system substrate-binding protein